MRRVQIPLAVALLFEGLFVLAFSWAVLVGGPIDFLYRSAAGLSTVRSVAQDATILAGIGLFIAAVIVALYVAFQPTSRFGRVLHVLPIYFLAITFVIGVASLFQIATTGTLFSVGMAQLTMSTTGIIGGVALSTVAVAIAAARLPLSGRTLRSATTIMGITIVPSVIAAVAVIAAVVIVSSTTPSFSFGGPGGPGGGGRNAPGGSGTQSAAGGGAGQNGQRGAGQAGAPAGSGTQAAVGGGAGQGGPGGQPGVIQTQEVPSGSAAQNGPGASGTRAAAGGAGQNGPGGSGGQPGGPGGQGGPGGGGPGGGFTSFVASYRTTGIVAAVFALIALIATLAAIRAMRTLPAEPASAAAPSYRREIGSVLAAVVGISVAIFVVIQFVPVERDNPPVQTTPNWDTPQTETLFMTACSNCHSNLTKWPWYSYVAPSSWLQNLHVHDARSVFNISELNKLPAFAKNMMANNVRMHLEDKTMPPADYLLLHPEARLTDEQRQQLIDGMKATLSKS